MKDYRLNQTPNLSQGRTLMLPSENFGTPTDLSGHETPALPASPLGDAVSRGTTTSASGANPRVPASRVASADLAAAQQLANLCERFLELTRDGATPVTAAARQIGKSPSFFSGENSVLARYRRGGIAALLPDDRSARASIGDLTAQMELLGWFIPAARFFYLLTNRTWKSGSVPEAIRRTISLPNLPNGWSEQTRRQFARALANAGFPQIPTCPEALREAILVRQAAGAPLVPKRIQQQIMLSSATLRQRRNATETALDYLNASGSLFFINDKTTGERRPPLAGEVIEADDATINFPVCVPWTLGGDPCSEKYGVKVGRFQWLVAVDAASRFVTAWSYVMRPRSSYRAEDALVLMRAHCLQHGIPAQWRFEQGVWKSNLVKHAIHHLGCDLHTVWSPHQKPFVEGTFNALWTKLAVQFPDSDVGRYRGENEAASQLITACQRGHQDPRKHFPMLNVALAAFEETIHEKMHTPVQSVIGSFVPAERWENSTFPKRQLDAETEWLFSPYIREWTVKGMLVGGRVPLFEDLSVPFDFAADWLPNFDGAKVRVHFNPAAPNCQGMCVLAQDYQNRKAGEVLGLAKQINEVAGYARLVLGWAEDNTNAGRLERQRANSALRREVRAVLPQGKGGYAQSEERDGVSRVLTLEKNPGAVGNPAETANDGAGSTAAVSAPRQTIPEFTPVDRAARLREIEEHERQHAHLFQ